MYTCEYQWLRLTPWRSRAAAAGTCVCVTRAPSNGSSSTGVRARGAAGGCEREGADAPDEPVPARPILAPDRKVHPTWAVEERDGPSRARYGPSGNQRRARVRTGSSDVRAARVHREGGMDGIENVDDVASGGGFANPDGTASGGGTASAADRPVQTPGAEWYPDPMRRA